MLMKSCAAPGPLQRTDTLLFAGAVAGAVNEASVAPSAVPISVDSTEPNRTERCMTVGRSEYGLDLTPFTVCTKDHHHGLRDDVPDSSIEGATVETEAREAASAPAARSPCMRSAATPTPIGACRADRSSPP